MTNILLLHIRLEIDENLTFLYRKFETCNIKENSKKDIKYLSFSFNNYQDTSNLVLSLASSIVSQMIILKQIPDI